MRHAERADASFDPAWSQSKGALRRPYDPPLTLDGLEQARVAGRELLEAAQHSATEASRFQVVVSSPYKRCLQTATEVADTLGATILIDRCLGEVFGPEVMGEVEPHSPVAPRNELFQICRERGVKVCRKVVGEAPAWPEFLSEARVRFVRRFLQYLHRCTIWNCNFVLVTHGQGVAAALMAIPGMDRSIETVGYCAFFMAKVCPRIQMLSVTRPDGSKIDPPESPSTARAACAWKVAHSGIRVGPRHRGSLRRRICRWAVPGLLSTEHISNLLRVTDDIAVETSHGLGRGESFSSGAPSEVETSSTILFGDCCASDIDSFSNESPCSARVEAETLQTELSHHRSLEMRVDETCPMESVSRSPSRRVVSDLAVNSCHLQDEALGPKPLSPIGQSSLMRRRCAASFQIDSFMSATDYLVSGSVVADSPRVQFTL